MQTDENKETTVAEEPAVEAQEAPAAEEQNNEQGSTESAQNADEKEAAEPDARDAKIEELQNRLLRLQADFDNFRRRNASEREQLSSFVTAEVVAKFLSVLDNFVRAEKSVANAQDVSGVAEGMEKIRRQFEQVFKSLEVEEIAAEGVKFDPTLHEAVMRGQNPELEDDTIEQVFEKGYKLRNRVIRHSKVKVVNNE